LGYYNRKLKRLGELVGSEMPLSSYTSRHTWATMARNYNVPISVISAGMGHTSEKTTQIYLASLENSVIDRANKEILAKLNANISK
ncbi:MAG TPA: integrase, partial [Porphyromonadaceae bacterium]|nr:integrase [Porphyromonadaceae bacterium]